jgi:hypothetical protein
MLPLVKLPQLRAHGAPKRKVGVVVLAKAGGVFALEVTQIDHALVEGLRRIVDVVAAPLLYLVASYWVRVGLAVYPVY